MLLNTTINLLSKDKKGRLEHLTKFIFVRDILEIVLLIYALLAIVLLWSWIILQEDFNNLAESSVLVNREYSKYNQDIRKVNNDIKSFNQVAKYYSPVAPRISDIVATLPNDIKINSLTLDRTKKEIVISGTALTRESLLNYQATVKAISWIQNIEAPTSQLFQKENINFEIKGQITGFPDLPNTEKTKVRVNTSEE